MEYRKGSQLIVDEKWTAIVIRRVGDEVLVHWNEGEPTRFSGQEIYKDEQKHSEWFPMTSPRIIRRVWKRENK